MRKDPIVEEIHAARRKLFKAAGNHLGKYLDTLREQEKEHPDRIVSKVKVTRSESRPG